MSKTVRALWLCLLLLGFVRQTNAQTPTTMYFSTFGLGFGARALGMGGAFIAIADDITAMNYNPAGLAQLIRPEFSIGMRYGAQSLKSAGIVLEDSATRYEIDPYTAAYYRFMWDYVGGIVPVRIANIPIVLGVSRSVKGSNKAKYGFLNHFEEFLLPEDSISSEVNQHITINNGGQIDLTSFSLDVRPLDFLYIGYNLNLWNEKANLNWANRYEISLYYPESSESSGTIQSTTSRRLRQGLNHDFGILVKLRYISLGFVYKTSFSADFTSSDGVSGLNGKVYWPYSYGVGLAMRPSDVLTISTDYNFAHWSAGRIVYTNGIIQRYPANEPHDTQQFRFGLEYLLTKRTLAVPLRLGGFINRLFWNDSEGKPVRFKGLTCGTGLVLKQIIVDIAAIYNFGTYSTVEYLNASPLSIPTKEANWEVLVSLSYRL